MSELLDLSVHLREAAAEAARSVSADLLDAFRAPMAVDHKRDRHDPVTVHDRRAEARIRDILLARVPDSTVIGEEDGEHRGAGGVTWYVDPIDGTANFASGLAFFCTSIGAAVDGRPVAGAVVDPVARHVFTADLSGARLGDTPLAARGTADESAAVLITGYPSARDIAADGADGLTRFGKLVERFATVRRTGSAALTLAHVAAGWCDAALGTTVSAWDVAAGRVLVEQAGGTYRGFGGDGAFPPGYVACTRDLRTPQLEAFTAFRDTRGLHASECGSGA